MNLRFSLADKISATVIVIALCGVTLVYHISNSFKQFAYQHHTQFIQQLAYLETDDLLDELEKNSLDLAISIENTGNFQQDFKLNKKDSLQQHLDNQFYQYFVTAGVLKLLKLAVFDTDFTLISTSSEDYRTDERTVICPKLSKIALARHGAEKLQTISHTCLYNERPVFAVIVPFGGLNPKGYIKVIVDLSYNLKKIEQSLAMPIQINALNNNLIFQSQEWLATIDSDHLFVHLPITNQDNEVMVNMQLLSDMAAFNKEVLGLRNWIMTLALFTTSIIVFIVLTVLRKSAIPPLAKIHDALEKIQLQASSKNSDNRLLFEQLLEQIIRLQQQSKTHFTVMIIDLTHFKRVNDEFGQASGDKLLLEVGSRLNTTLRASDLISWVGTDTPGHKLLPSDAETQYHSTIARLGGDEFGLLLPSASTEHQAKVVAKRIINVLSAPYTINDNHIKIECKIGISMYPIHGEDEKVLIRKADKAMFKAKELKKTIFVFEEENNK